MTGQTNDTTTAVLAELERLEQVCAEASPGPWLTDVFRESGEITWQLHITTKHHKPMEHGRIQNEKNERFAAESRDALPRLIAALRAAHEALDEVQRWSEAYPETVFSEPDWKQARQLLESGGITLDAVSAGAIRPVVQGIGDRARDTLATVAQALGTEDADDQ